MNRLRRMVKGLFAFLRDLLKAAVEVGSDGLVGFDEPTDRKQKRSKEDQQGGRESD